jgi:hypothetical protein
MSASLWRKRLRGSRDRARLVVDAFVCHGRAWLHDLACGARMALDESAISAIVNGSAGVHAEDEPRMVRVCAECKEPISCVRFGDEALDYCEPCHQVEGATVEIEDTL